MVEGSHDKMVAAQEAAKMTLTRLLQERGEQFGDVEPTLEEYEDAIAELEGILATTVADGDQKDAARVAFTSGVKDWATNLVPGAQTVKEVVAALTRALGGSLRYSSAEFDVYKPTSAEDVKALFAAWRKTQQFADEVSRGEALRDARRRSMDASNALTESLVGMPEDRQSAFIDLQTSIAKERVAVNGNFYELSQRVKKNDNE